MPAQPLLRFGPYRLEGTSGQLWRHTRVVHLPPKAAALWCLATQAGRVVTRAGTELTARVAAADTVPPGV
jgi:DNA-binding response OmpR family regulator